jgi:hypothetical protein
MSLLNTDEDFHPVEYVFNSDSDEKSDENQPIIRARTNGFSNKFSLQKGTMKNMLQKTCSMLHL